LKPNYNLLWNIMNTIGCSGAKAGWLTIHEFVQKFLDIEALEWMFHSAVYNLDILGSKTTLNIGWKSLLT